MNETVGEERRIGVRRVSTDGGEAWQLVPDASLRYVFLSPHLDDAVLSCGNLLLALGDGADVTVCTLFTEQSAPHTASARAYLRQCGADSAAQLYARRRAEDGDVLARVGATLLHAGLDDALFRKRSGAAAARLASLLPELGHVYPTYRWHVAAGRVRRPDRHVVRAVTELVERLVAQGPTVLVAPLGVGGHVDHVLVRDVAARTGGDVLYYADLPYALQQGPDATFTAAHRLTPVTVPATGPGKNPLIAGYRTQVDALFPGGVPLLEDRLHVPASLLTVVGGGGAA
ncbi:PIG-L family deacetylase [Paenibacillus sp. TRM 82003]|uniref:PIG-L deacetylase family protein n=1 Tax=Kineococcus sp. TRM81007 TaxID=2925831 RepID=UPI001F5AC84E|nr:PIG-L family deacetylase [Kineococcus sp. TRM81007]MCI2239731.1 PIG-L family deacetylase [Kineococcus sp. TRM81007]MCI3926706.1 PIG-L family deacetylase [Paenibacillus sp. TRM 82003]